MDFHTITRTICTKCYIIACLTTILIRISMSVTSNSACFGNVATNATKVYLNCQTGQTISLINVTVGAKASSTGCPAAFTDANTQDMTCCSPSANPADDCTFLLGDITDYETSCNGQQSCDPEAKNEFTTGQCDITYPASTIFMFIEYECITPVTTATVQDSDGSDVVVPVVAGTVGGGVGVVGVVSGILIWKFYNKASEGQSSGKVSPSIKHAADAETPGKTIDNKDIVSVIEEGKLTRMTS